MYEYCLRAQAHAEVRRTRGYLVYECVVCLRRAKQFASAENGLFALYGRLSGDHKIHRNSPPLKTSGAPINA